MHHSPNRKLFYKSSGPHHLYPMTATELQSNVIRITHALEGWIQWRMGRAKMRMLDHTRKRSVITHARKGKCMLTAETRTLMLSEMHVIFHVIYSSKLSDRDAHENGYISLFSYILQYLIWWKSAQRLSCYYICVYTWQANRYTEGRTDEAVLTGASWGFECF